MFKITSSIKKYTYSILGKNRGFVLSLSTVVAIFIYYSVVGPSNENNGSNLSLIIIAAIFISLHVYWDYRIKCNHRDVVIDDEGITFISHNGDAKKINWNEIRSVVEFPSSKDIYEDDFIKNIMSSGIRLSTPEEKFLIFTKMRRFQELKEFISNKLRCP